MIKLLIEKELKNILLSPKFAATFLVCSILILTSVYIGVQEYHTAVAQYEANQEIARQNIQEATNWSSVRNQTHRKPTPMQVFVSGLHFDVGRVSTISEYQDVKLRRSPYSDETLFALFRFIDLTFIIQVILSLFAILFTYDAINGERENGTLKLAFANSVSRASYLIAKFVGIWTGLIVPLFIPILIAILIAIFLGIPISGNDWIGIVGFLGLSVLYITFFIGMGLLLSAITKKSSLSFLLLLVVWIAGVLILPRMSIMASGQLVEVESVAQVEAKQEAFQNARWDEYSDYTARIWRARSEEMSGMSDQERQAYRDEREWDWLEQDDAERKQVQQDITDNNRKLLEEIQNQKKLQERVAFSLSRISPASSFRLAAMNIAGTDIDMKTRYEESMREYRDTFTEFTQKKASESGNSGGFSINVSSDSGVSIDFGRDDQGLDTSEMPQYSEPLITASAGLSRSILDFGLLGIFILLTFGGTFFSFLRYDMR